MKRTLALLVSLALLLSLPTACGGGRTGGEATASAQSAAETPSAPQNDGEQQEAPYLNALITSEPSSLDCARFLDITSRTILHSITEPLTRIENGTVTPAGAESWEISDDGLIYTFHLRENSWDDGEKVTADDYVYALRRQADPAYAWSFASDFFSIVNFESVFSGEDADAEIGVAAPDADTLVITLNAPNPAFLSTVDLFPCRQSDVESAGDGYGSEAGTISSCGPFRLDSWVHNSKLEFSKNELYWDAAHVALDRFSDAVITEEGSQMNSLENGSVDYANVSAREYAAQFAARSDMYELNITTDRTAMIVFNCEDPVFANAKIRRAFSLALDRDTLIELTNGGLGTPAYGLVPTVCYVGDTNFREVTAEPLLAVAQENPDPRALLIEGMGEAGLGSDPAALTVTFTYGNISATGRSHAEVYQQMWRDTLGVNVEIDFNESALASIRTGEYQIGSVGWGSTYEPYFQLSRWSTGGQSRWINATYASLVAEGMASMDDAVRLEKYQQAEALLINDAAIAPTYYNAVQTFAYNYVGGIPTNPFDTTGMKTLYTSGR